MREKFSEIMHDDFHDFDELPCIIPDEPSAESDEPHHIERVNSYREAGQRFLAFYDQVLAFIIESENPRLTAWCVAIASGRRLITGGISQVELAAKLGCKKQNVSKVVKQVQSKFGNSIHGIEPMPGQRSATACAKFARVRNKQLK